MSLRNAFARRGVPGELNWHLVIFAGLMLTIAVSCASCGKAKAAAPAESKKASRAVPVTVASVTLKDVPLELNTFGRAQAKATVAIKAQVDQVIQTVHFQQGQRISRGDLLFTLDSRPYQVALERAKAALSRDQVMADNARQDALRDRSLLSEKVLAAQEYDKAKAAADALAETLKADRAAIGAAQIDLNNCRICSPIDGRVGKLLVQAGNLVKANDAPLVVINQIDPIDVYFSLPQAELDRLRIYQAQGDLSVEATLPGDPSHPAKGRLTFIDNGVNTDNGTIEVAASFANPNEHFWPGRYVLVHLVFTVQHGATVAPVRAIQTGSTGKYVFVVKDDRTVEMRPVKVARIQGDNSVIEAGLRPGEHVVTDGQMQLEDGTKVEERTTQASTRPATESGSRGTP